MGRKVTRIAQEKTAKRLCRSKKKANPMKRKISEISRSSASAKKIKTTQEFEVPEDAEKHYRIIHFLLVFNTISTLVKCVACGEKINFKSCDKQSLGFKIEVKCKMCSEKNYVPSSEKIDQKYEINYRFIFIMRLLGVGSSGCNKFCGLMDLGCTFLDYKSYERYFDKIIEIVENVANRFFSSAANEEKKETMKKNKTSDLTVSGDGSWKKQGFNSLYGVASLIGYYTGKIIDVAVKSAYCEKCKMWENKCKTAEFEEWYEDHVQKNECDKNHAGPAGNMEVNAIVVLLELFKRSMQKFQMMYKNYIGDGDSKTFGGVTNAKPYGENFAIKKKEYIGHVQKRMGARLRNLVKNTVQETKTKGKTIRKKVLSSKEKLTAKLIDKLTIYYGLAIRRNSDSIHKMRTAIWATFFHYSSTDEHPQHEMCPAGADSWCAWQRAFAANEEYQHDYPPFPRDVLEAIKPIYEELSNDVLLECCLGGFTQNNNESFNQLVWKIT
ncbi:hypothetical protein ALC62_15264 [Cyphomyrmex costatus]|uniref:Mutator-like transposase domain-containing protein n=1 Tax=Cyphomyrmex costatus TaxID=456900 RepID=A0A151I7I8_9HYME|nr:hypothetical protein ALC62_15264 [Cyphomyrmex costatus]